MINAFISGFVKRATFYGINENSAKKFITDKIKLAILAGTAPPINTTPIMQGSSIGANRIPPVSPMGGPPSTMLQTATAGGKQNILKPLK
jgi:hypothetical protein